MTRLSSSRSSRSVVARPPFFISSRKGTSLWPNVTQQPVVVRINATSGGASLSGEDNAAAVRIVQAAMDGDKGTIEDYLFKRDVITPGRAEGGAAEIADTATRLSQMGGMIRQVYLRQRQLSDSGIVNFTQRDMPVAPGVRVRYVRNNDMEFLYVSVDVNVAIPQLIPPERLEVIPPDRFLLVKAMFDEDRGFDLDCMLRIKKPLVSKCAGWPAVRRSKSYPHASDAKRVAVSIPRGEVVWWFEDALSTGPEYMIASTGPLSRQPFPVAIVDVELYMWWIDIGVGDGNVLVSGDLARTRPYLDHPPASGVIEVLENVVMHVETTINVTKSWRAGLDPPLDPQLACTFRINLVADTVEIIPGTGEIVSMADLGLDPVTIT